MYKIPRNATQKIDIDIIRYDHLFISRVIRNRLTSLYRKVDKPSLNKFVRIKPRIFMHLRET